MPDSKPIRYAIYTRQSKLGLTDFSSCDAQFQTCKASGFKEVRGNLTHATSRTLFATKHEPPFRTTLAYVIRRQASSPARQRTGRQAKAVVGLPERSPRHA